MQQVRNRIAIVHGVNLDALGRRDPKHYGTLTLDELEREVATMARELELDLRYFQTNDEGEMVEHLHRVGELADGILINAGAWTHYSLALRDALEISGLPAVEVHLSDVMAREEFRHHSVFDGIVLDAISGRGPAGYRDGLLRLKEALT